MSYSYDPLNRLYAKTYSSGDPSVCLQYDQDGTNTIGRLTSEWTAPAGTACPMPSSTPTSISVPSAAYNSAVLPAYDSMGCILLEEFLN